MCWCGLISECDEENGKGNQGAELVRRGEPCRRGSKESVELGIKGHKLINRLELVRRMHNRGLGRSGNWKGMPEQMFYEDRWPRENFGADGPNDILFLVPEGLSAGGLLAVVGGGLGEGLFAVFGAAGLFPPGRS